MDFFKFSELKYERKRVNFSPYEFFFIISINTWCMRERNVLSRAVNVGAELNVYGNVSTAATYIVACKVNSLCLL